MLAAPEVETVVHEVLGLAQRSIAADAYAVWRLNESARTWGAVASKGLSSEYLAASIRQMNHSQAMPSAPLLIEDVDLEPLLAGHRSMHHAEGTRSLLVVPLRIRSVVSGTIAFYFHAPRHFSDSEVRVATALANLAAAAISAAEVHERQEQLRREAVDTSRRQAFLAEVSAQVTSSLDYTSALEAVTRLAVPELADVCAVFLRLSDGVLRCHALTHADPSKEALARELVAHFPINVREPGQGPQSLRTARSILVPQLTENQLRASARDAEHLRLLLALGPRSYLSVPLVARERTLGVMMLIRSESEQLYDVSDLAFAEEISRRAAIALDNSLLYQEAQDARAAAQAAVRARDEFLSVAAHELKTPITSLRGVAQLELRRTRKSGIVDAERMLLTLQRIDDQSGKLARLVNQLLDVSRIEVGKLSLDRSTVELVPLVELVVEAAKERTEIHSLTLQADPDLSLSIDPLRIEQVLINLLDNALKYSPGGGSIEVEVRQPTTYSVCIAITDHGIGIPPDHRSRIFDRFHQVHEQSYLAGLGLGLYISRQIVELHGGTLEADFPANGGSRFTVTLPIQAAI